ncbi:hypothetical protein [Halomonas sp. C22]|uniref:hypothetical protein n=1 Tax=Halomonas sp. C22 TaxID=2580567 RepID=UPI0011A01984|nr:hypothetical protein [Halomonas sp. C22]
MKATHTHTYRPGLPLFHSVLLVGCLPFFLGATLSNYAYYSSYQVQWTTLAFWLNAGGLLFAGIALLSAMISFFRAQPRSMMLLVYPALLLLTWMLGFVNVLIHARGAWGMMPFGFAHSLVVTIFAGTAVWVGFSRFGHGGKP